MCVIYKIYLDLIKNVKNVNFVVYLNIECKYILIFCYLNCYQIFVFFMWYHTKKSNYTPYYNIIIQIRESYQIILFGICCHFELLWLHVTLIYAQDLDLQKEQANVVLQQSQYPIESLTFNSNAFTRNVLQICTLLLYNIGGFTRNHQSMWPTYYYIQPLHHFWSLHFSSLVSSTCECDVDHTDSRHVIRGLL